MGVWETMGFMTNQAGFGAGLPSVRVRAVFICQPAWTESPGIHPIQRQSGVNAWVQQRLESTVSSIKRERCSNSIWWAWQGQS